jgi:hypothetical protein
LVTLVVEPEWLTEHEDKVLAGPVYPSICLLRTSLQIKRMTVPTITNDINGIISSDLMALCATNVFMLKKHSVNVGSTFLQAL